MSKEESRSSAEAPSEQSAADAVTAAPAPGASAEAEPERSEEEPVAGEGAAIPKQQSAAETADSEAGEGART
ncbi:MULTISPECIES: gliding motility protein [Streptomyces]|uniref:gliding motility protein n=1 Tax=Streptomyces TaxID=1883 RepID=UPI0002ED6A9B|nr:MULTISPECIES: gliding motility protein [Streptomyces]